MSCRGVHFALSEEEVQKLRSFEDEEDRLEYVTDVIEEAYFTARPEQTQETDKAWDAIHRCLTDGRLGFDNGSLPLSHVILGGEQLYSGSDYILSLKMPDEVIEIAEALKRITKQFMVERYNRINPRDYGMALSEEDREYTWEWFEPLVEFYGRAARDRRYVLFTVDQ